MSALKRALRVARWIAGTAALLLIVAVAAVAILAVRLSRGPIDVAWAVRTMLAKQGAQTVTVGEATLNWTGFHEGAGSPIRLVLHDLRVTGPDGAPRLTAAEGGASLSAAGLLTGEVLPRTAELRGAHLRARRDPDGNWQLDLGEAGDGDQMSGTEAELRRPPVTDQDGGAGGHILRQLRRLSLHDATIDVVDAQLGPWRLSGVEAELARRAAGGLEGQAELDATLSDVSTHLSVHASLAPGGGSRIELSAGAINPFAWAGANALLSMAGVLDAPVTLSATLELDPSGAPTSATVHASASAGQAHLPHADIAFDRLAAEAELDWIDGRPTRVRAGRLDAAVPTPSGPMTVAMTLEGARAAGRLQARLGVGLDRVAFADLDRIWPREVAVHAREWITANISAGVGRSLHMSLGLDALEDLSNLQLTSANGHMMGEDVTVSWLKPVAPVEHLNASLTLLDPDALEIAVDPAAGPAREGKLGIPGGLVRITGLAGFHQVAQINVDMAGSVSDTLALLRHPRLKLLSRHPIPIQSSAGAVSGKLGVRVPLEGNVDFDDIAITASVRMTDLQLGGIVAGRDLTHGAIQLDATNDGMKAQGRATLAGLPGRLAMAMDFRTGGPDQVLQSATFETRPDAAQLAAAGFGASGALAGVLAGAPSVEVSYGARRSGLADVQVSADLTGPGVSALGWRKPPGQPASARAHMLLNHDRLTAIDMLHAEGPGLAIDGHAELADGRPVGLVVEQGQLGQSRASGSVRFGTPLRVTLDGPLLDASTWLTGLGSPSRSTAGPDAQPGAAYVVDARFTDVLLGPGRRLSGVAAHADSDGVRLRQATLEATGISASLLPSGTGRAVRLRAADGGALLRLLDVTDAVQGGQFVLDAQYDDQTPGSPLAGTVQFDTFHVRQAPMIGKVLQALTLYGLVDALRGPGLVFERLVMPFRYAGHMLDLTEARAFSASLGITAQGRIDLGQHVVDLRGTVVPAYAINTALGRLPLIGRVFSPEESGGLVAARYRLTGPLDNPAVSVNPLSALTPGILRKLFDALE